MAKIMLVNSLYYPNIGGGAEISVKVLSESLVSKGFDVVVISIHPFKDKIEKYNNVKVYYLHHRNIYFRFAKNKTLWHTITKPFNFLIDMYNPFIGKRVKEIVKSEKPAVVHTNNIYGISPVVWRIAKKNNIPLIHTIRDLQLLCARGTMFKNHKQCKEQCLECKILTLTRRRLSKNIDCVTGVSKFILNKHLDFGMFSDTNNRIVIPNPLVSNDIHIHKVNLNNPIRFLYLGGVFEHKGFYLLIDAFSKLARLNNDWELWIAGRGVYEKKVNKNIKFLGFVKTEDIYPKADVVIVPSLVSEAFGRTVIEAYSYGLPVIGSNRGGIPEIIKHGKTGFIFNVDKKDDLLKYVKKFIDNPDLVLKMSSNCLKEARRFKPNIIVSEYIKLYKSLIEGKGKK